MGHEQLVADITRSANDRRSTGRCVIVVAPDGGRTMYPDAGANTSMTLDHVREQFRHVLATTPSQARCHLHLSGYFLARLPDVAKAFLDDLPEDVTISIDASALVLDAQQRLDLLQVAASCHVFVANRVELITVMNTRGAPTTVGQDSDVPASVGISLEESVDAMIVRRASTACWLSRRIEWRSCCPPQGLASRTRARRRGGGHHRGWRYLHRWLSRRMDLLPAPVAFHMTALIGPSRPERTSRRKPSPGPAATRAIERQTQLGSPGDGRRTLQPAHTRRACADRTRHAPVGKDLSLSPGPRRGRTTARHDGEEGARQWRASRHEDHSTTPFSVHDRGWPDS